MSKAKLHKNKQSIIVTLAIIGIVFLTVAIIVIAIFSPGSLDSVFETIRDIVSSMK